MAANGGWPRRRAARLASLAWLIGGAAGASEPALELRLFDIRAAGVHFHDCTLRIELRNGLDVTLKGFAAELVLFDAGGREVARKPFELTWIRPGTLRREGLGFKLVGEAEPHAETALELQRQCEVLSAAELRLRACETESGSVFDRCLAAIAAAPGGAIPVALAPDSAEEAVDYGAVAEARGGTRAEAAESATFADLGATLSTITPEIGRGWGLSALSEGLLVVEVAPGGAAAAGGLVAGDVVAEVDQEAVLHPRDVEAALARARAAGHRSLLVLVDRDRAPTFRVVRLE